MDSFKRWGMGVMAVLLLGGCNNGDVQEKPAPSSVTAAALQGDLTYQDVLEKGETIHTLAMMPDAGQIWVGTHAGLYSSASGGLWGLLSPQLEQFDIVGWFVDPDDARHMYVGGHEGVRRSVDGGKTWTPASKGLPEPAQIRSLTGTRQGDKVRLFAFVTGEGIYQSTDEGETWSLWQPLDQEVYAMDFSSNENRLYVAAQFSLLYNEEGQWQTEEIPEAEQIYSLSVNRRTGVLAVATEKGVYEKIEGEWRLLDARSPEKLIVIASGDGDTKWVGIGESALIYKLSDNRWTQWK
ncbi:WD40/YVTN/BNR-like repeat-containing protein [Brevibacillus sp. SAFN-007a]|uniref:WD40/YVTN/BNR-like repeat-containing protein n=1 Tax=Brevibacillus sp. SAFN-007a TaxID=3436862 RepID=UPI003F81B459